MQDEDKLHYLSGMTGGIEEHDTLCTYLRLAGEKILNRLYPYGSGDEEIPAKYHGLQCEIAAYMLNKRGAEGQTAHSENGISRSYGSADVPEAMLSQIVPFVGVIQ